MKQLTLVRHAKSSWDQSGLDDHDRPLNKRGDRDARRMAAYLAANYPPPDLILSSTAKRADGTSRAMVAAFTLPMERVRYTPAIYEASVKALLDLVWAMDDGLQRVMLVGHNPGFTSLLNLLSEADLDNLPTCGVARIEFGVDHWREVSTGGGRLLSLDRPKDLPD